MTIKDCLGNASDAGMLDPDIKKQLLLRFDELKASGMNDARAKEFLVKEAEEKAQKAKENAFMTETVRKALLTRIFSHRNARGHIDPVQGFEKLFESRGFSKGEDFESLRMIILAELHAHDEKTLHTLRKGWLTGDKRRTGKYVGDVEVKASMDNVIRELDGQDTGDQAAKDIAKTWSENAERLRLRFNELGGSIKKRKKWFAPQMHDREAMLKDGVDKWLEFTLQHVDPEVMGEQIFGRRMSDAELRDVLTYMFENTTSNGALERNPTGFHGKSAMFKKHMDPREIIFKNADSWIAYQKRYGEGDFYAAMNGYYNSMSRDIAAMTLFGPNPDRMVRYLADEMNTYMDQVGAAKSFRTRQLSRLSELRSKMHESSQAKLDAAIPAFESVLERLDALQKRSIYKVEEGAEDKLLAEFDAIAATLADPMPLQPNTLMAVALKENMADVLEELRRPVTFAKNPIMTESLYRSMGTRNVINMWEHAIGTANIAETIGLAQGMSAIRSQINANSLGAATLSAVTDIGMEAQRRMLVGMPMLKVMKSAFSPFTAGTPAMRRIAVRSGLIHDAALSVAHKSSRQTGLMWFSQWSGYLAERTMGLSGLAWLTQSRKHAFGLEFQGWMADLSTKPYDRLNGRTKRMLDRHGISRAEWETLRTTPKHTETAYGMDVEFLRPQEIADKELSRKYHLMIYREMRGAVIEPTVKARAVAVGGSRPGTVGGEFRRSLVQLKSFVITFTLMQAEEMAHLLFRNGLFAAAAFGTGTALILTMLGGVAVQLKNLSKGEDFEDMDNEDFAKKAFAQGGGVGILGDFINATENRNGKAFTTTLMGPMFGKIDDAARMLSFDRLTINKDKNEKQNAANATMNFIRNNTPVLSSLWYLRALYNRLILDQVQLLIDPQAKAEFAKREQRLNKSKPGSRYFYRPGDALPYRTPQFVQ